MIFWSPVIRVAVHNCSIPYSIGAARDADIDVVVAYIVWSK